MIIISVPFKVVGKETLFNERIIEILFVHRNLDFSNKRSILEVGPGSSWLSFELATFGHKVVGIGLKPEYPFKHPNLTFYKGDVLDFKYKDKFDYVIAVSVLEHIINRDKLQKIIGCIYNHLKPNGLFIVTVPIGRKQIWKGFYEVFEYDDWMNYCRKFKLINKEFYIRKSQSLWEKATKENITKAILLDKIKYATGSNSVGCFCFKK